MILHPVLYPTVRQLYKRAVYKIFAVSNNNNLWQLRHRFGIRSIQSMIQSIDDENVLTGFCVITDIQFLVPMHLAF